MFVTAGDDPTAYLWDAATRRPIGQPLVHHLAVNAVAFSPDSRSVVTGSDDSTARLWDTATGKPIGEPLKHDRPCQCRGVPPRRQIRRDDKP